MQIDELIKKDSRISKCFLDLFFSLMQSFLQIHIIQPLLH